MPNDSTAAGYLTPAQASPPHYDDELERVLHPFIKGVAGIADSALVRPRWQPEPPQMPEHTATWCAFGVTATQADPFPYFEHSPAGDGVDLLDKSEVVEVLVSFYGARAGAVAAQFRDGCEVAQNRAALEALQITVVECGDLVPLPDLFKQQWRRRYDVRLSLRRKIQRTYNVRTITSVDTSSLSVDGTVSFTTPL